ncbi:MAG: TatD family hydrolase [Aeromonas sp.]
MLFIDTHCHLDFAVFDHDRTALLTHCRALGIKQFIVPAITEDNWAQVMALADQYADLFYGLGIHPWYAGQQQPGVIDRLRARVMSAPTGLVAIGECGLDLRSHVPQQGQLELFEAQIKLAIEADLPLLIHSVRANDTVAKLLRRFKPPRGGIIHAFSGSLQQAHIFWQLGFRLGVGGVISIAQAHKPREVFQAMPLEALVLETDSPDMPLQGEQDPRNTPALLPKIAELLMALRQEPSDLVAKVLFETAQQLFHPKQSKNNK